MSNIREFNEALRRRCLPPDQQGSIKRKLTPIAGQLRQWPYPLAAPPGEIDAVISELDGLIARLDGRGPAALMDRCLRCLRRARIIRSRCGG
ncbi:hypothetical protein [Bradyrhizobium sp. 27S5]|uniref:hypothetical protein n=1 Tax=Bradyrhizobium sp. 27S5 TaxID=3139728 RepID=UPI0030CD6C8D